LFRPGSDENKPGEVPDHADGSKHVEHALPAVFGGQISGAGHRNHSAGIVARKGYRGHSGSFQGRRPAGPHRMDSGKGDALEEALDDADEQEHLQTVRGGQRSEQSQNGSSTNSSAEYLGYICKSIQNISAFITLK